MGFYTSNSPSWGLFQKFRAKYFSDIFTWIDVVFGGLSENELRILVSSHLGILLVKILEKSHMSKTEFFLCKFFGELPKSDKKESSKQFCREFFSLSFETSRASNRRIVAEKIEKYGDPRILAKK
jgi:hypothetical protein